MNLIQVKTGKANGDNSISECFVFHTPIGPDQVGVEPFIGKSARDLRGSPMPVVVEQSPPFVMPSYHNKEVSIGGAYATAAYRVADGVILKVMAKKRVGWNSVMQSYIQYLRVREGAAERRLQFTPTRTANLAFDWLGIHGRFDLITMEEAVAFGAHINEMSRRLYALSEASLVTMTELSPEATSPVTMKEVSGKLVPTVRRKRHIEEV